MTVTPGDIGQPYAIDASGPVYDAARAAFRQAWGNEPVDIGVGGSIPFIAEFAAAFPSAKILVTGVEDPQTQAHSINESLHLGVLERAATAEALLLGNLGQTDRSRRSLATCPVARTLHRMQESMAPSRLIQAPVSVATEHWRRTCEEGMPVCGHPFLVEVVD